MCGEVNQGRWALRAAAAFDAGGRRAAPAVVIIEEGRIAGIGDPGTIGPVDHIPVKARPDHVLVPGLVNAHGHLDLSTIPAFAAPSFGAWLGEVRARRPRDAHAVAAAIRQGARLSQAGGVAVVGDIVGGAVESAIDARRASGLPGVAFAEVFGSGATEPAGIARIDGILGAVPRHQAGVRLGLQPHAPYSCGPSVYRHAAACARRHDLPLSTHLAESVDETRFARFADGPIAEAIRAFGAWNEGIRPRGRRPVPAILDEVAGTPLVAVHGNDLDASDIERLAASRATVVFCPRAARFLGHRLPAHARPRPGDPARPHPWRALLAAGVAVALGTDGMPALPGATALTVLDDARLLLEEEGDIDARDLLAMMTTAGAAALGLPRTAALLGPQGRTGAILLRAEPGATDLLQSALRGGQAIEWAVPPREDPWA
ncbi:MAG: amidohydrolase family protein [Phycisphaeraceae bacterium]|nr:amidohydrolase family protein [Phycisphaeraceae bacterium]